MDTSTINCLIEGTQIVFLERRINDARIYVVHGNISQVHTNRIEILKYQTERVKESLVGEIQELFRTIVDKGVFQMNSTPI